jgi:hypothetical protein
MVKKEKKLKEKQERFKIKKKPSSWHERKEHPISILRQNSRKLETMILSELGSAE